MTNLITNTPNNENANNERKSLIVQRGNIVSRAVTAAAAENLKRRSTQISGRASKHYPVSVFYSMATEQDCEVADELAQAQKVLRDIKNDISIQSKNNFMLERDVRFLDSRIALLIQNRMAVDEQNEFASHLEEQEATGLDHYPDERKLQQYGNLFFLLQSEPRYIALLCRLVSLSEIDILLQTVMFTLYGNQYERRDENLLLTMFQRVLAAQFEATEDFGSLLRANTPVSRMLTTYTRRGPGQSYLKAVLSDKINELIEHKNLNLQINPLKAYEEIVQQLEREKGELPADFPRSVTPEVAESNPQVQALIKPRIETLVNIANQFLTTIINSLDQIPYGIRWICKQIRSLTKRKYPDASESAISSLIGGFFFLRFLNPAIVTPQAYMLIESFPDSHSRTILTLIAKMLQNLANKPSYSKETYMIPTNSFVSHNKQRIGKFLNDLCEVGDFYESLEMDQYMALSRKDICISITPNEIYNMQTMLGQHIDRLAPEPEHHLRILLDTVGLTAPPQVPRRLNRPIALSLHSRWETPVHDSTTSLMSDSSITQNDIHYMEVKSIFVQIIRSLPYLRKQPFDLLKIAKLAATSNDALLVSKGIKVHSMLLELEEAEIVTRKDQFRLLVQEINQELIHLGDLKKKVMEETGSLQIVFKTIQDHNNYLTSQLESYKAYLQNVRIQSGRRSNKSTFGLGIIDKNPQSTDTKQHVSSSSSNKGNKKKNNPTHHQPGPFKFTHQQLEKEGIIVASEVPEYRRANIFLMVQSPVTGTFIISLHYKGRERPILEIDLKLDDLLEKQKENVDLLDLEYIKLSVTKILQLLNKSFQGKSR
ncbi:putative ras GTPase-activating protein sar1 [Backusella circina FSU 941]|nr:putative ras GTPase-activating protein sar1 [Backusella circina FSU 941]